MPIAQIMLPEFKHEANNTRRVLERLTDEHFDWKPHEKSFSLGQLATHIAGLPHWLNIIVTTDDFDLINAGFARGNDKTFEEVKQRFETNIKQAEESLSTASDELMKAVWILRKGDFKVVEIPKVVAIRSMVINHSIHHRGELIVYMRLLGIKVPGLYGPSADE